MSTTTDLRIVPPDAAGGWSGAAECSGCNWSGLVFPDGRRRCYAHATADDVRLVDELDERAGASSVKLKRARRGTAGWGEAFLYPYGPNIDVAARARMLDWAEAHQLQLAYGRVSLTWLRGRVADRREDRYGMPARPSRHGTRFAEAVIAGRPTAHPVSVPKLQPWWLDHVTGWTRDGEPAVLVAQPYQLTPGDQPSLTALEADPAVRLELRAEGSWYGHGTWFVGVWRAEG